MYILSLYGKGNTGKTETINWLSRLIEANGGIMKDKNPAGREKNDYTYLFNFNGKIIAITTRGDDVPSLSEDFALFPKDIDIIICATRSKGKHVILF